MAVTASRTTGATATGAPATEHSYMDWAAVLAGAFVAAAIAYVLTTFGSAIGLTMTSPFAGEGAPAPLLLVAVGLWILWVAASSYMAGGYVAGRMRRRAYDATPHESDVRDMIHGIVAWAVASMVGALLIAMTAAGIARTGVEAASTVLSGAAKGVGSAAGEVAGEATGGDPLGYVVDRMMRGTAQGGGQDAGDTSAEVMNIVRRGIAQGNVPEEDRAYLAQVVARNTGLAEAEARARVDQGIEQAQAAAQQAKEAADAARKAGIVAAFLLAASLLVGAAAGAWGANMGGRHRDEGTDFSRWFPRR